MNAPSIMAYEKEDELARLVADIRAKGAGRVRPIPPADALTALAARLRDEKPMRADELVEHERQWRSVEVEPQALERADAQRERLL